MVQMVHLQIPRPLGSLKAKMELVMDNLEPLVQPILGRLSRLSLEHILGLDLGTQSLQEALVASLVFRKEVLIQ